MSLHYSILLTNVTLNIHNIAFYFTYYKPKPPLRHIIRAKWLGVTQHPTWSRVEASEYLVFLLSIISDLHYPLPTQYYDHEVRHGEGDEVVVHGGVEVGAAEDDEADREVAEHARDEDRDVEERDDDQGVVVVHLLGPQHHLQVVPHLRRVVLRGHAARLGGGHGSLYYLATTLMYYFVTATVAVGQQFCHCLCDPCDCSLELTVTVTFPLDSFLAVDTLGAGYCRVLCIE